jgi:cyclophilin family peptidyl-prolyl cis-trans isomerase
MIGIQWDWGKVGICRIFFQNAQILHVYLTTNIVRRMWIMHQYPQQHTLKVNKTGRQNHSKEAFVMRVNLSFGASLLAIVVMSTFGGCNKSGTDATQSGASKSEQSGQSANEKGAAARVPPEVVLETSMGPITIRLNDEKSPKTVENFLAYVTSKFYDRTIFHQVYKNQGIVGGAYSADMTVKTPGVPIRNEADNGLKNLRYSVVMLRDQDSIDSATSVFSINVVDNPALDYTDRTPEGYGFCVFGQVVQGMEVVDKIAAVEVQDINNLPCAPKEKVEIISAKKIK